MRYPAYPAYKDSSVPWLGQIPAHWGKTVIKKLARQGYKTFVDGDWIESPFITDDGVRLLQTGNVGIGEFKEQGFRYISEETFATFRCTEIFPGDVLICRLAEPVGRACLAPNLGVRMITSVDVCILKLDEAFDARFVVYFLTNNQYLSWMQALCRGGTRDRVSRSMLGAIEFPVPPLSEQRAIAAFLDRETARLNALVAKKERLIELLQEKRTALISHAVTKGLGTGDERVFEVPLKRWVAVKITDGPHETPEFVAEGIPFISAEAVQNSQIDFTAARGFITEETHRRYCKKARVVRGDILFCKAGATTGKLTIVNVDFEFSIWSPLAIIRPHRGKILPRFLFYVMHAPSFQDQVRQGWSAGTQPNIGMDVIERLRIAAPDLETQRKIVMALDRETAEIDALIAKVRQAIEKLREYRTALISAAVTGKIDVRET